MITVRGLKESDIPRIKELISPENPLDHFEAAVAIEKDGELVSFGVNRRMLEAVLYCSGSKKDKVLALRLLMEAAIQDAKSQGLKRLHAFVDENFYKIMHEHFGFEKTENICIYLDLE